MDKMLGLVKDENNEIPWEFRVERTYTKINGVMKYLHPLMKYPSLGLKADGIVRTEPDGTTPLIRIHEHRIDYVLRQH
jgi:hypothetical protein